MAALFAFMGYNFTIEDIKKVLRELSTEIIRAKIQEVYQPRKEEIYIELYIPQAIKYLLISIENGFNRFYLTNKKPHNPLNPYSFQMLLRKYLVPSYINEVSQINEDRVIRISTEEYKIYAELTGRHANIFLTNSSDTIMGSIRESVSQKRPLFAGYKYIPPFKVEMNLDSKIKINDNCKNISKSYSEFYDDVINKYRTENLKMRILRDLINKENHLIAILEKLKSDKERAIRFNDYLIYAEALKTNKIILKNADSALCEYYSEQGVSKITIPLKEGLTIKENMERYYKLYKKYKDALPIIEQRENEVRKNLEEILNRKSIVENTENILELQSLMERNDPDKTLEYDEREKECKKYPFKVYYIEGVGKIYSGSNDEENEILTFKFSRGNDLWFHIVGYSGSHVVLPLQKDRIPSEKQIIIAAHIAAARSSAPDGESVEVAYTRVKYVRKVKGGQKGSVVFSNEKRIRLKVNKKYISNLLQIS